jgi:hypothetical protein
MKTLLKKLFIVTALLSLIINMTTLVQAGPSSPTGVFRTWLKYVAKNLFNDAVSPAEFRLMLRFYEREFDEAVARNQRSI